MPAGAKRITVKLIFKTKLNEQGEVEKIKLSSGERVFSARRNQF